MVQREIWIQLENRPWDVSPNNIDRMTGMSILERDNINPVQNVTLTSPGSGANRTVTMFKPFQLKPDGLTPADALILRRYNPPQKSDRSDAWTVPDDRKINPWDLNEPDPTDAGTMGTIPGPVLECFVGDSFLIHFRNMDKRTHPVTKIIFVPGTRLPFWPFIRTWTTKTINVEEPLPIQQRAHSLHPHGITFASQFDGAYPLSPQDPAQPVGSEASLWSTLGVNGFKQGDRVPSGGTFDYTWDTIGWPATAGVWLYHDHSICDSENVNLGAIGILVIHNQNDPQDIFPPDILVPNITPKSPQADLPSGQVNGSITNANKYHPPQKAAQYLQLYHSLGNAAVCINGRVYLGNTPTMIASPTTLMRFGVVGMGDNFHTFHIHGHRWTIPGADGSDPVTIQNSIQNKAVSQFEDTRILGPATSFVFTIDEKNGFFRAPQPVGEWHMHCHVLGHMMMGMMGSLKIVNDNDPVVGLPQGVMCPSMIQPSTMQMQSTQVVIMDDSFMPQTINVNKGQKVMWMHQGANPHTVTSNPGGSGCTPPSGENFDSGLMNNSNMFEHVFNNPGTFAYHCELHGCSMSGTVVVT